MKILHVVPYLYPAMAYGGPAKLVFELGKAQQKKHQVSFLTSDTYDSSRRLTQTEKKQTQKEVSVDFVPNLLNTIAYTKRLFTHFGIIVTYLQKYRSYNLVHVHDVFVLPQIVLMYVLMVNGKRFIISPHGVLDPIRTEKKSIIKQLFLLLLQPCFKQAELLLATSDTEQQQLCKLFPKRQQTIVTIWNGVLGPKKIPREKTTKKIRLLYIGKLHPQKGIVAFLKAYSSYTEHFELTIAGPDDGDKAHIDALIKKENLSVQRYDFINEKQKQELYQSHDVFIHPSESEGFSIAIIEALSYGLPIFVTQACNFDAEEIKHVGFLIPDTSEKSIEKGLQEIIATKNELQKYGQTARALYEKKYTIERMAENLDKIIV